MVVTGALGPAASLALQLLVAAGATVVATGTGSDGAKLKALGAQRIIDYKKESFFDEVPNVCIYMYTYMKMCRYVCI